MSTSSNLNLNLAVSSGATGIIGTFPDVGIIRAIVLVPKGTVIPQSAMVSQSAFATYVNGKFLNDSQVGQWYCFNQLDKLTDTTKKPAKEETGRLHMTVYTFPLSFSCRYMVGMGNFIEAQNFNNCQGLYDYFFIDDFGNWHGTKDVTGGTNGLSCYTNVQFYVPGREMRTDKANNGYVLEVNLADPVQTNGNFKLYQAGTQPDAIAMIGNAVLTDISDTVPPAVPATSMTFMIKSGQDSYDIGKAYTGSLTAPCFVAYNLTTGASATISSITKGSTIVAGETYWWVKAVLSAPPTAADVVRISLAAPSVVNAIIPGLNLQSLPLNNLNGQNCAVKTF